MNLRASLATAALLAFGLIADAPADVLPEPPSDPIPEACKPLIGIWQRTEPEVTRWAKTWTLLIVDSRRATKVYYIDEGNGVNVGAQTALFHIDCRPEAGGRMTISLETATDEEGSATMDITLAGDSFTTTAETTYDKPGPPDPTWKPETYAVTYKRIAK